MRPSQVPVHERPPSNVLGTLLWHPELAKAFFTFNSHLFHSTLTARDREMVIVRVGWLRRCEYEWSQHVRLAQRAGMPDDEIDAISAAGPDWPAWTPRDAALLKAADEIVADRYISEGTWKRLLDDFDRQQLMDLVFTVGTYDMLAMAMNTFGVQLDPGLPGFPPQSVADDS